MSPSPPPLTPYVKSAAPAGAAVPPAAAAPAAVAPPQSTSPPRPPATHPLSPLPLPLLPPPSPPLSPLLCLTALGSTSRPMLWAKPDQQGSAVRLVHTLATKERGSAAAASRSSSSPWSSPVRVCAVSPNSASYRDRNCRATKLPPPPFPFHTLLRPPRSSVVAVAILVGAMLGSRTRTGSECTMSQTCDAVSAPRNAALNERRRDQHDGGGDLLSPD